MTRPRITRRFILTRALLRLHNRRSLSYPQVLHLRARIAQRLAK